MVLPAAHVLWPRDRMSVDRAMLLVVISGAVRVESDGIVVRRTTGEGDIFFVPPGDTRVDIRTDGERSEVFYISTHADAVADIPLPADPTPRAEPLDAALLAPLLAFAAQLCALFGETGADVAPLRGVAEQVTRALARLVASDPAAPRSLFDRATRILLTEFADQNLGPRTLADRLGVSVRSLQLAFHEQGVTVADSLRDARAAAAQQLRRANPALTSADLARLVGFGSVETLHRALRTVREGAASAG